MAKAPGTEIHEKLSDVTECSICAEIFTNPKFLPCVHTFCLQCLEKYGEDKNPGDHMACPLCRNEFVIPKQGLSELPNNFFIGKIVEIGKLATVPAKEAVCDLCFEQSSVAKMFCMDCEQKLCERCNKSHSRIKLCQNHHVVELGSQVNVKELNFRNSYCEHHPKELIKMYCYEDNVAICLICFAESHQSHRCSNVDKAAGQFKEQLNYDRRKVGNRRPECDDIFQKLDKFKKEFLEEVLKTEERIRKSGAELKKLIDQHVEELVQNLRLVRDRNLKCFETTKQDVDRFRVMIDSYQRYCDELLTRGSSVDICRDASQMHTRASDLEKQSVNWSVDDFYCDQISFQSANLEILMNQHRNNNVVGELRVTKSTDRIVRFQKIILVERLMPMDLGEVDLITTYMKDELQRIQAEFKDCSGSIDESKDEPGFVVRGNETGVGKVAKDLLKLADSIVMYDHDIDRPGIPAYFYSMRVVYGRGVYFVKHSSLSAQNTYSPSDVNGYKHVYQCKVLTGDYAMGNQSITNPPPKSGNAVIRYQYVTFWRRRFGAGRLGAGCWDGKLFLSQKHAIKVGLMRKFFVNGGWIDEKNCFNESWFDKIIVSMGAGLMKTNASM